MNAVASVRTLVGVGDYTKRLTVVWMGSGCNAKD